MTAVDVPRHEEPSTSSGGPAAPASQAYGSQAGRYDRRTDAFRTGANSSSTTAPTARRHRPRRGLRHRTVPAAAAAQGRPHRHHRRDRRLRTDAPGCRRPGHRARLGQRAPDHRPVRAAPFDAVADAALFCAVHDVMQCPTALSNVFDHLRPGAPVAAVGGKWPAPWMWPLRAWVTAARTVHQRFHRLRQALATTGPTRPRPPHPGTGLRRRIPRPRPRQGPLDTP